MRIFTERDFNRATLVNDNTSYGWNRENKLTEMPVLKSEHLIWAN